MEKKAFDSCNCPTSEERERIEAFCKKWHPWVGGLTMVFTFLGIYFGVAAYNDSFGNVQEIETDSVVQESHGAMQNGPQP